ncbi:hypothetical protein HispidOSU_006903, partial [Sigmodon hispidus]
DVSIAIEVDANAGQYGIPKQLHIEITNIFVDWYSWSRVCSCLALHPIQLSLCHRPLWEQHDPLYHCDPA